MKKKTVIILTAAAAVFLTSFLFFAKNRKQKQTDHNAEREKEALLPDRKEEETNKISSFFYTDWDNMYQQNHYYAGQLQWDSGLIDLPVIRNEEQWCLTHAFNMGVSEYTVPFITPLQHLHDHSLIIYAYNENHNEKAKASVLSELLDSNRRSENSTFALYLSDSYFRYKITDVRRITEEEINEQDSSYSLMILVSSEGKQDGYIAVIADKTETVSYE